MHELNYINKPNIRTLRADIRKAYELGATTIELIWGENQILIEWNGSNKKWTGSGWIGRNGGFDLANELNIRESFSSQFDDPIKFLKNHLTIINVK
jgi:hypothetical protein